MRSPKIEEGSLEGLIPDYWRPRTWQECQEQILSISDGFCPFVGCRHHLYLDVNEAGVITFNFPDLEPWEIPGCCALEVASRDLYGQTLEECGRLRNVTRERIRQIEAEALRRVIQKNSSDPLTCNTPKRITRIWGVEDDDDAAWVVGLPAPIRRR